MADVLATGTAWLRGKLQAYAAQDVVYKRGATTLPLKATRAKKLLKVTDEDTGEIKLLTADRDYILSAVALGVLVKPQKGDTITDAEGIYEVCPPMPGEQEWQAVDPHGEMIRVFTKFIGQA